MFDFGLLRSYFGIQEKMDIYNKFIGLDSSSFILGLISGFVLFIVSYRFSGLSGKGKKEEIQDKSGETMEFSFDEDHAGTKMVLVVRNELKMGKGKAAAQCSHAAVMAQDIAARKQPLVLREWKSDGQRKIVVKADTEKDLLKLAEEARKVGLIYAIVRDAGLTQLECGTMTVLAVGPGEQALVDKVTSHLKLY